ncbi:MAG: hypothetical protein NTY19_43715 [Planctomycetota bacterium]|nr:hypothetical protein [Planctomycetota bacterium]
MRKILASSSFAIGATFGTMIDRLKKLERTAQEESGGQLADIVGDDFEQADSVEDEWKEAAPDNGDAVPVSEPAVEASAQLLRSLLAEAQELTNCKTLAESIGQNAKGVPRQGTASRLRQGSGTQGQTEGPDLHRVASHPGVSAATTRSPGTKPYTNSCHSMSPNVIGCHEFQFRGLYLRKAKPVVRQRVKKAEGTGVEPATGCPASDFESAAVFS